HDQWHAQPIAALTEAQRFLILDLHDDRLTRPDIRDLVGKDVAPVLLDEARLLAFRFRRLVDLPRLAALLDLAFDEMRADLHLQRVDGRRLGERKEIDALDPALGRVLEALRDLRSRD